MGFKLISQVNEVSVHILTLIIPLVVFDREWAAVPVDMKVQSQIRETGLLASLLSEPTP